MNIPLNDTRVKIVIETIIPSRIVVEEDSTENNQRTSQTRRKSSIDEQTIKRLTLYTAATTWTTSRGFTFIKEWCKWTCCKAGAKGTAVKTVFDYEDQRSPKSPKEEKMSMSIEKVETLLKITKEEFDKRKEIMKNSIELAQ